MLPVDDVESAAAWYESTLALRVLHLNRDLEGDDPTNYAVLAGDSTELHLVLSDEVGRASGAGMCMIDVDDVDQLFERLGELQVKILRPLVDQAWGARDFAACDLFGSELVFTQRGAAKRTV